MSSMDCDDERPSSSSLSSTEWEDQVGSTFFTQSKLIEPVSPQVAQLGIHFLLSSHTINERCTSLRDLIKETQLVKGSRKRRKKPSNQNDTNPQSPAYKTCALSLCYNRGPKFGNVGSSSGNISDYGFKWPGFEPPLRSLLLSYPFRMVECP